MSDEKIDLAAIAAYERGIIRQIDELAQLGQLSPVKLEMRRDAQARLALVAAVRAARAYMYVDIEDMDAVEAAYDAAEAALASFTDSDSAEVRSDA